MSKYDKLLVTILVGSSDPNISFKDLSHLMLRLGFEERFKEAIIFLEKMALKKKSIFKKMVTKPKHIK